MAERLRTELKVPERRWWRLKLKGLSHARNWAALWELGSARRSPIGFQPFADACIEQGAVRSARRTRAQRHGAGRASPRRAHERHRGVATRTPPHSTSRPLTPRARRAHVCQLDEAAKYAPKLSAAEAVPTWLRIGRIDEARRVALAHKEKQPELLKMVTNKMNEDA